MLLIPLFMHLDWAFHHCLKNSFHADCVGWKQLWTGANGANSRKAKETSLQKGQSTWLSYCDTKDSQSMEECSQCNQSNLRKTPCCLLLKILIRKYSTNLQNASPVCPLADLERGTDSFPVGIFRSVLGQLQSHLREKHTRNLDCHRWAVKIATTRNSLQDEHPQPFSESVRASLSSIVFGKVGQSRAWG